MHIFEHKTLWNLVDLVDEYNNSTPKLSYEETFLVEQILNRLNVTKVENILCVGCGAGREVLPLHEYFPETIIFANDISEKMIICAAHNFEAWGIKDFTKTLVCAAENIPINQPLFQIVTCFSNVLSLIPVKQKREAAVKKFYEITANNGILIGMVHHMFGTPQKSFYFLLQKFLLPFFKYSWGNRVAGRKNQKYLAHYFQKRELFHLLRDNGYTCIKIFSLEEFYQLKGKKYNRLKGFNNLMFIAQK